MWHDELRGLPREAQAGLWQPDASLLGVLVGFRASAVTGHLLERIGMTLRSIIPALGATESLPHAEKRRRNLFKFGLCMGLCSSSMRK